MAPPRYSRQLEIVCSMEVTVRRSEVARLEEIDEVDDGRCLYRPVRHCLGITSFGVNAWTARTAGDRIINEHDESGRGEEELYFVQQGHARFELDGERLDAPEGTFVFVRPHVKRTAFAAKAPTTIIVVGGTPGKIYEPQGLEFWAPLLPLYNAGEYGKVVERLRDAVDEHPEYPALTYNLACCESLAGQTAEAIEHLRQAIDRADRFRVLAADDTDLEALRDEPLFNHLLREK